MTRKAYLYQRFSSDKQAGNSSLFRQTEAQKEWLQRNPDVVVVETNVDSGFSGYSGEHLKSGSLGKLVAQIEAGEIEKGSLILVEQFSRLSRLDIDKSEDLIKTIWKGGITLVLVRDDSQYPPESVNISMKRMRLLFEIDKAHSESQTRSIRAKGAHAKKRHDAKNGITPRIRKPFWLDTEGKLNKYHVAIVDIFDLYISGLGQILISRALREKYPDFKPIQKMSPHTIIRIILNEIVIGKWQDTKVYEAAVSNQTFYEACQIHKKRLNKNVKPNRKWPLSGLIQCGHCNKGMSIQQSKDSLPLLRCSNNQRLGAERSGCGLPTTTFPYAVAEYFYDFIVEPRLLNELTIESKNKTGSNELNQIDYEIQKLKKRLAAERKRYDKLSPDDESFELAFELMQETGIKVKQLEKKRQETEQSISFSSRHEISKDIFKLAADSSKLNIALHKFGFKMTLTNRTLSYGDLLSIEYISYSREHKRYLYKGASGNLGYISTIGRTHESYLNKPPISGLEREAADILQQNYIQAVKDHAAGKTIRIEDIMPKMDLVNKSDSKH